MPISFIWTLSNNLKISIAIIWRFGVERPNVNDRIRNYKKVEWQKGRIKLQKDLMTKRQRDLTNDKKVEWLKCRMTKRPNIKKRNIKRPDNKFFWRCYLYIWSNKTNIFFFLLYGLCLFFMVCSKSQRNVLNHFFLKD